MKSYFIQASAECTHPGEFWKKFKPLLPSKGTRQHIQLLEEGRLISDNREIANIFNKHFIDGVAAHIPTLSEHAFANHLSVNKISQDHCIAIAVDLSKAFNSMSHNLVISKLKAYGFAESATSLIRSYLCGRIATC